MSSLHLALAAAPKFEPSTRLPGFLFTAALCLFFLGWAAVIGVRAYRARDQRHTLHGGAWGVTGPWAPPPARGPQQFAAAPVGPVPPSPAAAPFWPPAQPGPAPGPVGTGPYPGGPAPTTPGQH